MVKPWFDADSSGDRRRGTGTIAGCCQDSHPVGVPPSSSHSADKPLGRLRGTADDEGPGPLAGGTKTIMQTAELSKLGVSREPRNVLSVRQAEVRHGCYADLVADATGEGQSGKGKALRFQIGWSVQDSVRRLKNLRLCAR